MMKMVLDMAGTYIAYHSDDTGNRRYQDHGLMRFNCVRNVLEVYDSDSDTWADMANLVAADPVPDYSVEMEWVRQRMLEDAQLEVLRQKYPTLDEAYTHYRSVLALVHDHDS